MGALMRSAAVVALTRPATRAALTRPAAVAALMALTACGGGGGVNSTPAPPPPMTPTPTPTPTPAPSPAPAPAPQPTVNYDTREYRATIGAVSMNALAAYQRGATGAGITVGVIDSGVNSKSPEFENRLSSASANVGGGSGIDDEQGHGTAVAFTIAGRRDGNGAQGVAFGSTLVVARADTPGTCTAPAGSAEPQCSFDDNNIARGVDLARTAGARVINISLGGEDFAPTPLIAAIDRATAAGIVVVISAGNDGTAQPSNSAQFANNTAVSRNLVIVAGSVDSGDAISSFSNRAGDSAIHFLTANGERVQAPNNTGTEYLWSGTSFAAPQISAAVALLAQAYPNLTGTQIVDLLYRTARDAGTAGVDSVYGRGVLDLTRAFQPFGATSVAGSTSTASLTSNGVLSAPMGDARAGSLGTVILDSYNRAFAVDLGQTLARHRPAPLLTNALQGSQRAVSLAMGGMSASLTLAPRTGGGATLRRAGLTDTNARAATLIAGRVTQRIGSHAAFGLAVRDSSAGLAAELSGTQQPAFLVARDDALGFENAPRTASAMRQTVNGIGITAAIENGDVLARRDPLLAGLSSWRRSDYQRSAISLDRRDGGLRTSLALTRLAERNTLLGAQFDPALGALGATSWFAEARARLTLEGGWSLGGSARQGWTRASGGWAGRGRLRTAAFAMDMGKDGLFGGGDSAGLRLSQPLRVSRGGIDMTLPTEWDYASGRVSAWTTQSLNLAPGGRELDAEARYGRAFAGGWIESNVYWRRDPGNIAALADDMGMALRFSRGF